MNISKLEKIANEIRQDIVVMLAEAGSGHSAGPLGMADIFTALYFEILNIDPEKPYDSRRDRVVLSCGHIVPVLYATLARRGYFSLNELKTLRKINSNLQGHSEFRSVPGLEVSAGPLGQGVSQAIGMALVANMENKKHRIYCISSDGEQQEGQTWEAIMFAGNKKINNLTLIIDRNNIQIDGPTEQIMPLEPLVQKYQSFNWHTIEIDGHNFEHIAEACEEANAITNKPSVIIAHTIPGKGVSFMENDYKWHGKTPNSDETKQALRELRSLSAN